MYCENCERLEKELTQALVELREAKEASEKSIDLLMKGEALREKMMFEGIVGKKA